MTGKVVLAALLLATVPIAAHAADADNAAPPPAGSSYFQGTWAGSWPGFVESSATQDVTIVVGRKTGDKTYEVTYSWGAMSWRNGNVLPGKVRAEGKEQDDKFLIRWENKLGRKFEIELRKREGDTVKARLEKSGPTGPGERPYVETNLKRR